MNPEPPAMHLIEPAFTSLNHIPLAFISSSYLYIPHFFGCPGSQLPEEGWRRGWILPNLWIGDQSTNPFWVRARALTRALSTKVLD